MANETLRELYSININEELPITLESACKRKKSVSEKKSGASAFYSDMVTPSIGNETMAKTSGIGNFTDTNFLNNLKKELFEIN